ncbi:MAG: Lrp/AsnC family transcriptional regulator [Pseudomonadota bacterium]
MDDLDRRLIALLRTDARRPVSSLALDLGLSRATVRARIDRLLESGAIQGFSVVLPSRVGSDGVRAVMMIEVEGRAADQVIRRLHGFPEVRALHTTNGRWDAVAELETADLESFDAILRRVRLIDGIVATETSLLLATRKGAASAG